MSEQGTPLRQESAAPVPRPSRFQALLLWLLAGVGLFAVNLLSLPLFTALRGMNAQLQSLLINLLYYLPFIALPVFLLAKRREGLWQAYRPYPISLLRTISIALLAIVGLFFFTDLSALWSILLEALGIPMGSTGVLIPGNARELTLCVLYMAVLPAVCEEFLFRGVILSAYERYGSRYGIVVAALLFALLHGSIEGLPVEFLVGLVLGDLVVCCDSVYAGIIYHTVHNAASILLQFVAYRNASPEELAQQTTMLSAIGGVAGLPQLLLEIALFGVMMFFSLRMLRLTSRLRGVQFLPAQPREKLRGSERALLLGGILLTGVLYALSIWVGMQTGGGA